MVLKAIISFSPVVFCFLLFVIVMLYPIYLERKRYNKKKNKSYIQ